MPAVGVQKIRYTRKPRLPVKKCIRICARFCAKGASAPTDTNRAIGASGGVKACTVQFSKTTQQDLYFGLCAPTDLDDSEPVVFRVLWPPGEGWTAGNYVWKLEFLVKKAGDAYNTGTPTTISVNETPPNATDLMNTAFSATIPLKSEETLLYHFYRDVALDNADDTGDVLEFAFQYVADKLGEEF